MLRHSVKKPRPSLPDKLFWILFSRYVDGWRKILVGLHPCTVVRWQRQGFRLYWRRTSWGTNPGRPAIDSALRKLIREMQTANIWAGVFSESMGNCSSSELKYRKQPFQTTCCNRKDHLRRIGGPFIAILQNIWQRWISSPPLPPDFRCFIPSSYSAIMTAGKFCTLT